MLWMRSPCRSQIAWRLDFSSIFCASSSDVVVVDVGKLRHQIRQHEGVRLVRVQELAALLREIGLLGALVDGEE